MSGGSADGSQPGTPQPQIMRGGRVIGDPMSEAMALLDTYAPWLLFLGAFAARLLSATTLHFPALDDPAYYLKVAENLAAGRGLTVDAIWGYLVSFPLVTHASNEHWMPLASLVLAPFFAVFGPSYSLAQTVGAAAGGALAPITWFFARAALRDESANWRGYGFFAGLLIALNPLLMYQSVTGDSAVYFALFGGLLCLLGVTWLERSNLGALATGLTAGLAYLARSEGLVLAALLLVWVVARTPAEARLRRAGFYLFGVLLLTAPWLVRNALTFGAPFPVPSLVLAALPDYISLFHYGAPSVPFATADLGTALGLRLESLAWNSRILLVQALFPLAPLALIGAIRLRRAPAVQLGLAVLALLFLTTALAFPVLTLNGTFYHAVGALMPVLALLGGYGLFVGGRAVGRRAAPNSATFMAAALCGGVIILQVFQLGSALEVTSDAHTHWQEQFQVAADWLADKPEGVVVTNQPNSLHYATGRPAVMLPLPDGVDGLRAVAQRYNATYLVAFWDLPPSPAPNYPDTLKAAGIEEVLAQDGVYIYRLR